MKKREAPKNCKRGSKQRRLILDTVRSGGLGHPTVAEVYDAVRGEIPNISLGTVYRNLGSLASDGEISRLDLGDVSRFDCDTSEHSHFACKKCGAKLGSDDIAIHQKLVSRNDTEFFCIDCLAGYYRTTREVIQQRIDYYRKSGKCTLFR